MDVWVGSWVGGVWAQGWWRLLRFGMGVDAFSGDDVGVGVRARVGDRNGGSGFGFKPEIGLGWPWSLDLGLDLHLGCHSICLLVIGLSLREDVRENVTNSRCFQSCWACLPPRTTGPRARCTTCCETRRTRAPPRLPVRSTVRARRTGSRMTRLRRRGETRPIARVTTCRCVANIIHTRNCDKVHVGNRKATSGQVAPKDTHTYTSTHTHTHTRIRKSD